MHLLLHTLLVSHALLLYIYCILITRLVSAPTARLAHFTWFVNVHFIYWPDYLVYSLHTLLISNTLFLYTWYILLTRLFGAPTTAYLACFTCFVTLYLLHFNNQIIKCTHCKACSFHSFLYICCILMTRLLSAPLASLADFTCFVNVLCILLTRYLLHCLHRLTSNINGFYICICFITQVCYCTRCIVG